MATVVSEVDDISVRLYGTEDSGDTQVERSVSMGTMNTTRYEDAKMKNIVNALKPVMSMDVTKTVKTVQTFLSVSE